MSHSVTAWYAAYYLGSFAIGFTIVLCLIKALLSGRRRGEKGDPREDIERARREERLRLLGKHVRFAHARRLARLVVRGITGIAWIAFMVPGRILANLHCADRVEEDLDDFARRLHAQGHRVTRPLCLATPLTVHWFIKCVGCKSVAHLVETSHYGEETALRVAGGHLYQTSHCTARYLPKHGATPQPTARRVRRARPRRAQPVPVARNSSIVSPPATTAPAPRMQPMTQADVDGEQTRSESA